MVMPKGEYEVCEALNPFFEVVMEGLRELVDGDHYFDTIAEDAFFEFRYRFSGWPLTIRGRANLMASFSGYGKKACIWQPRFCVFVGGIRIHNASTCSWSADFVC